MQLFGLAIAASLAAFILTYLGKLPRLGYVAFWAAMGVSMMVKGPAGPVLILATVAVFLLLRGRLREFPAPVWGILAFTAIVLPWYLLVQSRTGGAFLQDFIFRQNLARAAGKEFSHNQQFYFYIPVYLLGLFPWSVWTLPAWRGTVRLRPRDKAGEAALFLGVWMLVVFVVFSLLRSKLFHYIFPMAPALSLLIGYMWSRAISGASGASAQDTAEDDDSMSCRIRKSGGSVGWRFGNRHPAERSVGRCWLWAVGIAGAMAVAMIVGQRFLSRDIPGLAPVLTGMGCVLVAGAIGAAALVRAGRESWAFAALCGGAGAFMVVAVQFGLPVTARSLSQAQVAIAGEIARRSSPDTVVFAYGLEREPPVLAFYSQRVLNDTASAADIERAAVSGRRLLVVAAARREKGLPGSLRFVARSGGYLLYEEKDR